MVDSPTVLPICGLDSIHWSLFHALRNFLSLVVIFVLSLFHVLYLALIGPDIVFHAFVLISYIVLIPCIGPFSL